MAWLSRDSASLWLSLQKDLLQIHHLINGETFLENLPMMEGMDPDAFDTYYTIVTNGMSDNTASFLTTNKCKY